MTDLRSSIQAAYTLIRSIESNKSASALTLDHVIQEQITLLQKGTTQPIIDSRGESQGTRTSRFDQMVELQSNLDSAVQAIQDAGDDQDKLEALGIFEANKDTVGDSDVSSNVGGTT